MRLLGGGTVHGNIIKECKEIFRNFIFSPPGVDETMQLKHREYKDDIAVMA